MKKINQNKIFSATADLLVLFLFTLLIYGFLDIVKLGLYSDDWERHNAYLSYTRDNPITDSLSFIEEFPFVLYRAPQLALFTLSAFINNFLRVGVLGFIYVNFLLNYLIFIVIYYIINHITKDRPLSLFSVFFIGSIFGRDSTFYWGSTQPVLLSTLLLLVLLLLLTKRNDNPVILFFVTLISVWSYEISVIIPFFILFYYYYGKGKLDKRVFSKVIISASAVFFVLCFKFYLFPKYVASSNKASSISEVVGTSHLKNVFNYPIKTFFDLNPIVNYIKNTDILNFDNFLITITMLVILYLALLSCNNSENILQFNSHNNKKLLYYGLCLFILSTLVIKIIGFNADIFGKANRVLILPVISYGFILINLFYFIKNRSVILILLIILTSLNIGMLGTIRKVYINSWSIQEKVFNNILDSVNSRLLVKDNSVIYLYNTNDFLEYGVPVFDEYWTVTYFMKSATGKSNIEAYFVKNPDRVSLKSQWTRELIHRDRVVFYDAKNNVFYKNNE